MFWQCFGFDCEIAGSGWYGLTKSQKNVQTWGLHFECACALAMASYELVSLHKQVATNRLHFVSVFHVCLVGEAAPRSRGYASKNIFRIKNKLLVGSKTNYYRDQKKYSGRGKEGRKGKEKEKKKEKEKEKERKGKERNETESGVSGHWTLVESGSPTTST